MTDPTQFDLHIAKIRDWDDRLSGHCSASDGGLHCLHDKNGDWAISVPVQQKCCHCGSRWASPYQHHGDKL